MSERVTQVEKMFANEAFPPLFATYQVTQRTLEDAAGDFHDAQLFGHIKQYNSEANSKAQNPFEKLTHREREALVGDWELDDESREDELKEGLALDKRYGEEFTDVDLLEDMTEEEAFFYQKSEEEASFYRKSEEADASNELAKERLRDLALELELDEFALWSVLRACDGPSLRSMRDSETLAKRSVARFDALDERLILEKGNLLTFIASSGLISSSIVDGRGLGLNKRSDLILNRSQKPIRGIPMHNFQWSGPAVFEIKDQSGVRMANVADDMLPVGTWSDMYDVKGWRDPSESTGAIFFGEPTDGELNLWRVPNPSSEFYERALERARLTAGLALGSLSLKDMRARGFVIYESKK